MRKTLSLLLVLLSPLLAWAQPEYAVVRLPSHGGSGTVIQTGPGRSLILSCAHAFKGSDRGKPITVDVPTSGEGPAARVGVRLLDVDYQSDLSLIQLDTGPLPWVAPVAPAGYGTQGRRVVSAGYDSMKWPATVRTASPLLTQGTTTYTREKPWHGRSGGGLLAGDYLVGVVSGYEAVPNGRGIYVSHQAVLSFLARNRVAVAREQFYESPLSGPQVHEQRSPAPALVFEDYIRADHRVLNRTGSQCVWASLETLCRHLGVEGGYRLTQQHRSVAEPWAVAAACKSQGIPIRQQMSGNKDLQILREALTGRRGAAVGVHGRHMLVCLGVDATSAYLFDNMPQIGTGTRRVPLDQFLAMWDGWAVVVTTGPAAAAPPGQVRPRYYQSPEVCPGGT